jgi:hypothetical protein
MKYLFIFLLSFNWIHFAYADYGVEVQDQRPGEEETLNHSQVKDFSALEEIPVDEIDEELPEEVEE